MSHSEKSRLYQELKSSGYTFEKHYNAYTTEELQTISRASVTPAEPQEELLSFFNIDMSSTGDSEPGLDVEPEPYVAEELPSFSASDEPSLPQFVAAGAELAHLDPDLAGSRAYQDLTLIEVDDLGREWYQKEVRKSTSAAPRGRRVITYTDPGVVTATVQTDARYQETVEMPGTGRRVAEARITLPSWQVGKYRRPGIPFLIITYAGNEGFDFTEVNKYFGGTALVPATVKRKYVEGTLCYSVQSVVFTIKDMARNIRLTGLAL